MIQVETRQQTEPYAGHCRRTRRRIYRCFADLLDYPGPNLADRTRRCVDLLGPDYPDAAEGIRDFLDFAENTPLGRLEEIYTGTFDVNPACYIFAGYMLFGESFKRGRFLVQLQEKYRERGFSAGDELADHVPVLFRFLATLDSEDVLAEQLVDNCLVPVLQKMNANFKNDTETPNPYARVLRAILVVLEGDRSHD
ncbi:MAG: hypothetical protein MAG451_02377 [Anaerolineales bacterium]|nr:hypothetical protein [Anaerolineales bacterium]